jgi:hypothetical protein
VEPAKSTLADHPFGIRSQTISWIVAHYFYAHFSTDDWYGSIFDQRAAILGAPAYSLWIVTHNNPLDTEMGLQLNKGSQCWYFIPI